MITDNRIAAKKKFLFSFNDHNPHSLNNEYT